ncbi:MAG: undecaprenyl/decaprenyl-phosphate alpha-N-acetylglucosaminyl 1-phosphate transferase [Sedimentisphaerales bacterium]|nr:undecaprenyl/decaprenyl-phosphate alpha-N-acetylglucosaminyl 1-phosphate transferase [Sedimentisphaerales bacterium]
MANPYVILGAGLATGSFLFSAVLTVVVRRISLRSGFVARPTEDRYHRSVIPLGGGIAIFWTIAVFLLAAVLGIRLGLAGKLDESIAVHVKGFRDKTGPLLVVLGVTLLLHLVGLWDDRRHLGPKFKLAIQFLAAILAAVFADIRVELFIDNKLITTALSVLWIVVIMNAFNFLDNMDGLAAGMAVIVSLVLFWAATLAGQVFVGAMALLFIGSVCGFLVFNFPPARIFMGDCGSLVIGFFVALLTLRTTYYHQQQSGGFYAVFLPLVVMAVPLYDFVSVTLLRISQGKSPFVGDTQHFSHRLRRRGLSDLQTVLTLYLATFCTCIGAIFLPQVNLLGAILIFTQTILILVIIAILEMAGGNDRKAP